MKINYIIIFWTALLLPNLSSCQNKSRMKFSVEVVDDAGKPIANCEAGAIFYDPAKKTAKGFYKTVVNSDVKGIARFDLFSSYKRVSYGVTAPDGFYQTFGEEYFFEEPKKGSWQPENKIFKVIMKRIKKPIAMHAKKGPEFLPAEDKDLGYDLFVGDWVEPYGMGENADIFFKIEINKISKKESTSVLTVRFVNEHDGLIPFEAPIHAHGSKLRSDYTAPDAKYVNSLVHTRVRKPGVVEKNTRQKKMNYYIRVRTELDGTGNVVSAHYGKIYGDFMDFTHYLNPKPNDRNVEFDPKKNLILINNRKPQVQKP